MLFSSYEFILVFLPIVIIGYHLLRERAPRGALLFLVLASFFFYGYWRPSYLVILATSIAGNFLIGRGIARNRGSAGAKRFMLLGVALNLAALGYYKYAGLFVGTLGALLGRRFEFESVVLPLAISFFTFQQIAYLLDIYRGKPDEPDLLRYVFFVVFFPHLIAGPLVHHRELLPQLSDNPRQRQVARNLALGFSFFAFGLFKKVVFADTVSVHADATFESDSGDPSASTAWFGTLAYALQLYFDFSGYSDMAIGLAALFGLRWPLNFNSPYKALSIKDFWRRWHMTLSRFLRDYLYVPLGGNRRGPLRQNLNLFITMLLGGIWHGAAWKFMLWGGLHGGYLVVQRGWESLLERRGLGPLRRRTGYRLAARVLTLVCVLVAWVPFRADNMRVAIGVWKGMSGMNGLGQAPAEPAALAATLVIACVALFAPNTQQVFFGYRLATETYPGEIERPPAIMRWRFRPSYGWGVAVAALFVLAFVTMSGVSPFIYYQF